MPSVQEAALVMLRAVYRETKGDREQEVDASDFLETTGLQLSTGRSAINYLIGKGLVRDSHMVYDLLPVVNITTHGIDEIETALRNPQRPTSHFPAAQTINIYGGMSGGAIQQGNVSSTQNYQQRFQDSKLDFSALVEQLGALCEVLKQNANSAEHYVALGHVAAAEIGAKTKDQEKISTSISALGSVGKWVAEMASKVAAPLATEVIKRQLGLS